MVGLATPILFWCLNWVKLKDKNSKTLFIPLISFADAGLYVATAKNEVSTNFSVIFKCVSPCCAIPNGWKGKLF